MNLKIYLSKDSPLIEEEMEMKEVRSDVIVEFNDNFYDFQFITLNRLNVEVKMTMEIDGFYEFGSSTIIVEKVCKKKIIEYLSKLNEDDFDRFTTISLKIYKFSFPELQDINNWIRIY